MFIIRLLGGHLQQLLSLTRVPRKVLEVYKTGWYNKYFPCSPFFAPRASCPYSAIGPYSIVALVKTHTARGWTKQVFSVRSYRREQ